MELKYLITRLQETLQQLSSLQIKKQTYQGNKGMQNSILKEENLLEDRARFLSKSIQEKVDGGTLVQVIYQIDNISESFTKIFTNITKEEAELYLTTRAILERRSILILDTKEVLTSSLVKPLL